MDFCSLRSLITDLQLAEDAFTSEIGLTTGQASLLCAISHGYTESKELQRMLALTPSRITRIIDAMTEKGLVARSRDEHDHRAVSIALTCEGVKVVERAKALELPLPEDLSKLLENRIKEHTWKSTTHGARAGVWETKPG